MAACGACGTTILFGGMRSGNDRYCNAGCHERGALLRIAQQLPPDFVAQQVGAVYRGACPRCSGPGPVEVHKCYRIWSLVLMTSWETIPRISCRSCGLKGQAGSLLFCLALGWWGFPWGLVLTPVQIVRNVVAMLRGREYDRPSADLERAVSVAVASQMVR